MNDQTKLVYNWLCQDPKSIQDVDFFVGVYTEPDGLWCNTEHLAMMLESYVSTIAKLGIRGAPSKGFSEYVLCNVDWLVLADRVAEDRDV